MFEEIAYQNIFQPVTYVFKTVPDKILKEAVNHTLEL